MNWHMKEATTIIQPYPPSGAELVAEDWMHGRSPELLLRTELHTSVSDDLTASDSVADFISLSKWVPWLHASPVCTVLFIVAVRQRAR